MPKHSICTVGFEALCLEGVLTDAKSAQIIRNILAPHFRSEDFYGGITAAVSAMETVIGGEFTGEQNNQHPASSLIPIILILLFLAGLIGLFHKRSQALGRRKALILMRLAPRWMPGQQSTRAQQAISCLLSASCSSAPLHR